MNQTPGDVIAFVIIGFVLYFLPTLIAQAKHRRNLGAILMVNLLGCFIVPWFVALVWAMTESGPQMALQPGPQVYACAACGAVGAGPHCQGCGGPVGPKRG